ncbi:hypothetical protein EDD85DRAFT_771112 [Armillaria nabsnona]|nr:hypothetical protein EDD85DRAFT_780504 [Armillaria nabsnona]KAK0237372.1 hypothetical protein EDD85DRAFT_771112 [Armillaria nabsnona]
MPKPKVNELSTLRRHCQSFHKATYQKWAGDNGFASMLPDDRKELKAAKTESERQTRLDPHLKEREKKEVVLPYTDELFREVSIEWLVATDQPIDAFEHPAFKKMIHIASRASDGVRIPNRKQTRRAIMETFKRQLFFLRKRLQVRNEVLDTGLSLNKYPERGRQGPD